MNWYTVKHCSYYIFGFLIFAAITLLCGISNEGNPSIENGILDLHNINLDQIGPIKLNGDWEFYWNQLLSPEDFLGEKNVKAELTGYMKVPGGCLHVNRPIMKVCSCYLTHLIIGQ